MGLFKNLFRKKPKGVQVPVTPLRDTWVAQFSHGLVVEDPLGGVFQVTVPHSGKLGTIVQPCGDLSQLKEITVRYHTEGKFLTNAGNDLAPPLLSVYFQQKGDNWSAAGHYGNFRWYSFTPQVLKPGEHTFTVKMSDRWISVGNGNNENLASFDAARRNAGVVGFVLGGGNSPEAGRAHGVKGGEFTLLEYVMR
jgi:hypothetical protein